MTYVLLRNEHIASKQQVLLTKNAFPVPAFAYLVRKRLTKKGPDPMGEDPEMKELRECAEELEEVVRKTTSPAKRPPEVSEQHARDGHMPKLPGCPVCVEEHGSVVRHFASTSSSLRTSNLILAIGEICAWMESDTS